jgi:hypothetical protein
MSFDRIIERTNLQESRLPEHLRNDLSEGIPADSRDDAESIVENLRKLGSKTPSTAPSPAPTP